MNVLVINCGSSSVKYQLINVESKIVAAEGIAERIGESISLFTYKTKDFQKKKRKMLIDNHEKAIQLILEHLQDKHHGVIQSITEIKAIGHRLVHAGEHYSGTVIINDHVIEVMKECTHLAPLHNPANILGVEAMKRIMPDTPQCGLFDTAFHQTMPERAYLYALPIELYDKYKIRRYGFHGTSHKFVSQLAADYLQQDISNLKIITCHVGNGASITAIDGGESIDTSMGLTPLEGLMMGTRCGDLDPAIPIFLVQQLGMTIEEVNTMLNKKSGMLGLSNISNDMREIEEDIIVHKKMEAIRAHDVYAYRIKKYIGAYTAAMNGVDVLVFTGGVGENMPILRSLVCQDLDYLGIQMNEKENDQFKDGILELQSADSRVKILKIPTNEELMIALETKNALENKK